MLFKLWTLDVQYINMIFVYMQEAIFSILCNPTPCLSPARGGVPPKIKGVDSGLGRCYYAPNPHPPRDLLHILGHAMRYRF